MASAPAVTGRFNIIVQVVVARDVDDPRQITSELIPGAGEAGDIARSEAFAVMASFGRWVSLPQECRSDIHPVPAHKEDS